MDTGNGALTRPAPCLRVLGPVGIITRDGTSLGIGHRKLQLLLAALVLEPGPGRVIDLETLTRRLWPVERPDHTRDTLRTYISRLRALLAEAGDEIGLIETAGSGYRLAVEPEHLDVYRFERSLRQAREMAAGGNLHAARDLLTDAERVWLGPALDGLKAPWAVATRAELHRRRDRAKLARIAMDVATGAEPDTVLDELSELVAFDENLDQDAAELLLYLLAAAKQRRAAAATYKEVRRTLRKSRSEPRPELADFGEHVEGVEPIDATAALRRAWRRGLAPNWLEPPIGLIGREETSVELFGAVSACVASPSGAVHVIHGAPGIGKSALAMKAADSLVSAYCDGALHIDLRGSDPACPALGPRDMIAQLLDQIAVRTSRPSPSAPLTQWAQAWSHATRDLRLLVLLDDARDADQVMPLIHGGPGLIVLVTSRQRIELPGAHHTALAPLTDLASARLIGAAAGRHFPDQHRAMQQLITLCSGSPLALILIGANLRIRPDVPAVVKALKAIVVGGQTAGAGAVGAAYELSFRALAPVGVELLKLITAVSSPQVGVHDLAARADSEPAWALEMLDAFVQMRLLQEADSRCYRVPATLREAVLTRAGERL